jgi:hypothetical protein
MKTNAIDWLMKSQDPSVAIPAADIPDRNKKLGRGYDNPFTGAALCPKEYPPTAEYMSHCAPICCSDIILFRTFEKIKAGDKTFPINGMIPAFVYPSDHPYDEDDIEDKLLEGPLPIAARLLFISFFLSTDKTFRQRSRSTRVRRRHFRLQASIAGGLGMRHGMAKTRLGRVMSVMYAHK